MTSRRLLDPVTKTLLDAADLIEKRGWWDGSGPQGRRELCADLALGKAAKGHFDVYNAAYDRLSNFLGVDHIPKWNDNEARTGKAVIAALRAASVG